MKKISKNLFFLLLIIIVFFFAGCKEEDSAMSINERIENFISGLNDDPRNSLKDNFHPDSGAPSYSSESYWESKFPNDGSQTYSKGSISTTGSATRDVKIIGGLYDSGDTFSFTMKEEDTDDWYILDIDLNGSNFVPAP